ncbi:formylmethanofuran dehydrogenase subunit D [Saccharothrix coeruleofusca]|uniref:DUF397 domain-containing protein n=1 Tax=Saccharothrix coeruleofusca TaxID=33919 RepID=UPI001AE16E8A|nr:DUF397 domain-containing protein [Saccharothrix coeruleofusca]MBP2340795.1 formylmethanofuran dehydrogenase subunit D [Saccharothrix coeruleofusca]
MTANIPWGERRTSSFSDGANTCVEVAHGPSVVGVWDTKHRESGPIVVPRARWAAFVAGLKD